MRYYITKGGELLGNFSEPQELKDDQKQFSFENDIIHYSFNGSDLINTSTQADYDAVVEFQAEETEIQLEKRRLSDGQDFAARLVAYIKGLRINPSQKESALTILRPVRDELLKGEWEDAQALINAINRPSGNFGSVYDRIKNKIDNYLV